MPSSVAPVVILPLALVFVRANLALTRPSIEPDPSAAHTIRVGSAAVSAHRAHGDTLGPCAP